MTADRRAEVFLPPVLDDLAQGPYPDYVEDVVQLTSRMRQRPAWTFGRTWLRPLGLGDRAAPGRGSRWRLLTVAALIAALLLATVFVLTAGSRRAVPAPFGPARAGLIAFERDGDIHTADPVSGLETSLVSGPTTDVGPRFSPDGTRVLFERKLDTSRSEVWMVDVARRVATRLTPEPVVLAPRAMGRAWERYQMAPDGQTVVIATMGKRGPGISIARVDGTSVRRLDVGRAATEPSFRPPDGREILFVGRTRSEVGVYAVDPTTLAVRTIVTVAPPRDLAGASWSPDGSHIAYWVWSNADNVSGLTAKTHVVRADGTGDRVLPSPPGAVWNAHATWSNDGTRLFVVQGFSAGFDDVRGYVVPADGRSAGIEVAPAGFAETACCAAWMWSPDDTRIFGRPAPQGGEGAQQVIVDVAMRTARRVPWTAASDPTWQRLAP